MSFFNKLTNSPNTFVSSSTGNVQGPQFQHSQPPGQPAAGFSQPPRPTSPPLGGKRFNNTSFLIANRRVYSNLHAAGVQASPVNDLALRQQGLQHCISGRPDVMFDHEKNRHYVSSDVYSEPEFPFRRYQVTGSPSDMQNGWSLPDPGQFGKPPRERVPFKNDKGQEYVVLDDGCHRLLQPKGTGFDPSQPGGVGLYGNNPSAQPFPHAPHPTSAQPSPWQAAQPNSYTAHIQQPTGQPPAPSAIDPAVGGFDLRRPSEVNPYGGGQHAAAPVQQFPHSPPSLGGQPPAWQSPQNGIYTAPQPPSVAPPYSQPLVHPTGGGFDPKPPSQTHPYASAQSSAPKFSNPWGGNVERTTYGPNNPNYKSGTGPDRQDWSPLMNRIYEAGPHEDARSLVAPLLHSIHHVDKNGQSNALIGAVIKGRTDIALELVSHGANLAHTDRMGRTAFGEAVAFGQPETAQALLNEIGNRHGTSAVEFELNRLDAGGLKPLAIAARNGKNTLPMLLSHLHFSPDPISDCNVALSEASTKLAMLVNEGRHGTPEWRTANENVRLLSEHLRS